MPHWKWRYWINSGRPSLRRVRSTGRDRQSTVVSASPGSCVLGSRGGSGASGGRRQGARRIARRPAHRRMRGGDALMRPGPSPPARTQAGERQVRPWGRREVRSRRPAHRRVVERAGGPECGPGEDGELACGPVDVRGRGRVSQRGGNSRGAPVQRPVRGLVPSRLRVGRGGCALDPARTMRAQLAEIHLSSHDASSAR